MTTTHEEINIRDHRGLYRLESSSSSVYYLDTRDPRYKAMRARGKGHTGVGPHDDQWVDLAYVTPFDQDAPIEMVFQSDIEAGRVKPWVLIVGERHQIDYRVGVSNYWWIGRVLKRIVELEEMPPEGERTIGETEIISEGTPYDFRRDPGFWIPDL